MPQHPQLIGTFAGHQIQASEYLRSASVEGMSDGDRLRHLDKAAMYATAATKCANNMYERALAYAQYQCAMGIAMLVQSHIHTEPVEFSTGL